MKEIFLICLLLLGTGLVDDRKIHAEGTQKKQYYKFPKEIKPHWFIHVLKSYSSEEPQSILFLNKQADGSLIPVKLKTFYPEGMVKSESDLGGSNKDTFHKEGTTLTYYRNGHIRRMQFFAQGIQEAEEVYYNDQGKIKSIYHLKGGIKQGAYKLYFDGGGIYEEGFFDKGYKTGECCRYYSNKEKQSIDFYSKGLKQGICKEWYE